MKKRKLEAEFEYNFSLYGLIAPHKEYKLAWLLNKQFGIQLEKVSDIEIEFLKNQDLLISNYLHKTEHSCFRMLRNKSVDPYADNLAFLIPELKRFDYLIIVKGYKDTYSDTEIKNLLSNLPKVQYVQKFVVDDLKSRENLIF